MKKKKSKTHKKLNISHSPGSQSNNGQSAQPPSYGMDITDQVPLQLMGEQQSQKNDSATTTAIAPNRNGLPDQLKAGIEQLSGYTMDDVKVHYNSDKPAQLQAHAYAQGTDIHLASGQEKHLPHEAWHVVQQKQGRVKPTMQMKGKVNVNDNTRLEKEADVMGSKALQMKGSHLLLPVVLNKDTVIQRMVINLNPEDKIINEAVPKVAKRKLSLDKFSYFVDR